MNLVVVALLLATAAAQQCAVERYGAVADGRTETAGAALRAIADCAATGGEVVFGNGSYYFGATVAFAGTVVNGLTIRGVGYGTVLLWATDQDLVVFGQPEPVAHMQLRSFTVASVNASKSINSTAFRFTAGFVRSGVEAVLFVGQDGGQRILPLSRGSGRRAGAGQVQPTSLPSLVQGLTYQYLGSCLNLGTVTDTSSVFNTVIWMTVGTGITVGRGSEVRILGGRVIGGCKYCSSIGIHVTGNNGGVHVDSTDVIALNQGLVLDNSSGAGSNREIMITQATFDSDWRGISVFDQSYIAVAAIWAASCDQDNIWLSPGSSGAIVTLAGGTIFNAGAEGGDPGKDMCNGIVINAGRVTLNGVLVRNNKGRGIWMPADVANLLVSGSQLFDNGQNVNLTGHDFLFTSNICTGGSAPNEFGPHRATGVIANNVGCE